MVSKFDVVTNQYNKMDIEDTEARVRRIVREEMEAAARTSQGSSHQSIFSRTQHLIRSAARNYSDLTPTATTTKSATSTPPYLLPPPSNNKKETVVYLFNNAIDEFGIPSRIRTDKGGENILVWEEMERLRGNNRGSYIAGSSST